MLFIRSWFDACYTQRRAVGWTCATHSGELLVGRVLHTAASCWFDACCTQRRAVGLTRATHSGELLVRRVLHTAASCWFDACYTQRRAILGSFFFSVIWLTKKSAKTNRQSWDEFQMQCAIDAVNNKLPCDEEQRMIIYKFSGLRRDWFVTSQQLHLKWNEN
ncbi:hypothetical protein PR048_032423 [Dryococelus australis]|uniref:Uncharacterized protein n=1 Tax=Dryococelus australis TaxID=614101 RepID=A0ABQ9G694_9NEOP|nr:hypothetical protein PR048_032423 [Dryococelus australis]